MKFLQDLEINGNKGKLYLTETGYHVEHEKVNPSVSEKLELLVHASHITAEMQGISVEAQLSASEIL